MPLFHEFSAKDQSVAYYALLFENRYGRKAADAYTGWANAEVAAGKGTPYQTAQAYLLNISVHGLAKAIQQAITLTGKATAESGHGSVAGLNDVARGLNPLAGIADFFGRLSEGSTWLRIGEGLLGIILLAIGVARITHAVPAATKIAKTVGAVSLA